MSEPIRQTNYKINKKKKLKVIGNNTIQDIYINLFIDILGNKALLKRKKNK